MKKIIINSSWLNESDLRLDATFHLSDGPVTRLILKRSPNEITDLKSESKDIFKGNIFKRTYVLDSKYGHQFMTASNMMKSSLAKDSYVSKKYTNLLNLVLEKGWILISRSGTLGNAVFTNEDFAGIVGSDDLIRVIPNEKRIKSGVLYAYLASHYGYGLLTQSGYGGVIQHIESHHLENLPIPILPEEQQKQIHKFVSRASKLRSDSNRTLRKILGNIDSGFTFDKPLKSFSVNIQSIKQGDKYTKESRLESDYYQPSTVSVINQIKKKKWQYLGDLTSEIHRSGLRDRKFVNKGIPLITGQNLNLARLTGLKHLSRKFTRNIGKNTTEKSDILITVQGTIGKIEYVYKNMYQGVFASEQLSKLKVKSDEIHPGYLFAFLLSKAGNIQLLKHKTGSVIEWIKENNIGSVVIPIPEDKGESIGKKINLITRKRELAFQLENQAIDLVEKEIESWQK